MLRDQSPSRTVNESGHCMIVNETQTIEIVEFDNWTSNDKDGHLRDAFLGELELRLSEAAVRLSSGLTIKPSCQRRYELHGSFLCSNEVIYINVSLSDPLTRHTVFTDSYKDGRESILRMTRTVSADILKSLDHSALWFA